MSDNLLQARELLKDGYTCVLCKDDIVYTSTERGVMPLVKWIETKCDLHGFSAADKIVGKAAAMLYILLAVKDVYAPVMSEDAVYMLSKYGIDSECDKMVKTIINREGTDICPMDKAVANKKIPQEGWIAIQSTLESIWHPSQLDK